MTTDKIGFVDVDILLTALNKDCEDMNDEELLELERDQFWKEGPDMIHDATYVDDGLVSVRLSLTLERPEEVDEENLGGIIADVVDDAMHRFDVEYRAGSKWGTTLTDRYYDMTAFDQDVLADIGQWILGHESREVYN